MRTRFTATLIPAVAWAVLSLQTALSAAGPKAGTDWGGERGAYTDAVTGARVYEVTRAPHVADNLYFHASNFTSDNRCLIFVADYSGSKQLFRMEIETGRVVQLTDERGLHPYSGCADSTDARRIYCLRGQSVLAVDILDFSVRVVGEIPGPCAGGLQQPTLSGDGKWLALGKQRDQTTWEIGLMNAATGEYRTVLTQGFRIGHVQHCPTAPVIFYVWETSGYAPQRSWLVNTDGTGNRPFYARTSSTNWFTPLKEWVTHESWVKDTGEMIMVNDKLGVMVVEQDGSARLARTGNYWHAAARPDGKVLVMDDSQGRLWLAETATGNVRLVATGLRTKVPVHPHASFDRTGRYLQFHTGHTHETVAYIDLNELPPASWTR